MLHVIINGVHVVDAGGWSTLAIFGEVSRLPAIETWPFGASGSIVLLCRGVCHSVVLRLSGVGVSVILVLPSIIGCSGAGEIHRYLYVVIGQLRGVGGVVCRSLWLGPWLILGSSSPCARSELSLGLVVVEPSWVWQSSSGPNEFDHLPSFRDIDGPGFVLVIMLWEWNFDDFVQDARGESVEEESDSLFVAHCVSCLAY
jgi:hypothetical protein